MNPRRNEIYMAEVEFADMPKSKPRPVLIISNNRYNENHPDVITIGMTTAFHHDCFIELNEKDLTDGDFYDGSGFRYDHVQRASKNQLKHKVGKISDEFHKILFDKIVELIK